MSVEEFYEAVIAGSLIPYDGIAQFIVDGKETDIEWAFYTDIPKWVTKIAWYNR